MMFDSVTLVQQLVGDKKKTARHEGHLVGASTDAGTSTTTGGEQKRRPQRIQKN